MSSEYIDTAEQAKLVRQALKSSFPGVKFSVKISRYSGGSSVHVSWVDGPTSDEVEAVADAYDGKGMTDTTDYWTDNEHWLMPDGTTEIARGNMGGHGISYEGCPVPPAQDARRVRFSGSVSCQRELSDEYKAEIIRKIEQATGETYGAEKRYDKCFEIEGNMYGGSSVYGDYGSSIVWQIASKKPGEDTERRLDRYELEVERHEQGEEIETAYLESTIDYLLRKAEDAEMPEATSRRARTIANRYLAIQGKMIAAESAQTEPEPQTGPASVALDGFTPEQVNRLQFQRWLRDHETDGQLTNVFSAISATCGAPKSERKARPVSDSQSALFTQGGDQLTLF